VKFNLTISVLHINNNNDNNNNNNDDDDDDDGFITAYPLGGSSSA